MAFGSSSFSSVISRAGCCPSLIAVTARSDVDEIASLEVHALCYDSNVSGRFLADTNSYPGSRRPEASGLCSATGASRGCLVVYRTGHCIRAYFFGCQIREQQTV